MRWGVLILILVACLIGCKGSGSEANAQSRELFVNACSRCHGVEGVGGLPIFDGGPSPRNFHDHEFQKSRTDEEIRATIKNGKGVGMPPFGSTFDDAQIAMLVAQVRSFDSH